MAKFISVMNHELTEEQKKDAINTFAEINDIVDDFDTIPFPQVDPKSTSKEMDDLVAKYESEIVAKNPSEVLLQGEMIFTRRLAEKLKEHNINVVAARSERVSVETKKPDGTTTKTATFQHRGFLSYFTEEEVKKIKENRIKDKLEKYVNKKNSLIKNDSEFQKIKTDDIIVSPINDLELEKIKQKEAMSKAKVDISQKKEEMKNIKKLLNDKTEVGKEKDKDIDLDLF